MEFKNELIRLNDILENKKVAYCKFEELTDMLSNFDVDQAESIVRKRERVINTVKKLNREFREICDIIPIGQEIKDAVNNTVDWSDCKKEYQTLFQSGQDITATFSRIKRKEVTIVANIEVEKEKVLNEIKKQNNSAGAKTVKYYKAAQPMGADNFKILNSKL